MGRLPRGVHTNIPRAMQQEANANEPNNAAITLFMRLNVAHDPNESFLGFVLRRPAGPGVDDELPYHNNDTMTAIRPISDLRNKTQEISDLVHESDQPVFITKNGVGDMVVLSIAAWERDQARWELYRQLEESEADWKIGARGITLAAMKKKLKR